MSQNPLERAKGEIILKMVAHADSNTIGNNCSEYYNGLQEAVKICQRILEEENLKMVQCSSGGTGYGKTTHFVVEKPCEPAPKMRWEVIDEYEEEKIESALSEGYEPFAVVNVDMCLYGNDETNQVIYFKRLVPCEKE